MSRESWQFQHCIKLLTIPFSFSTLHSGGGGGGGEAAAVEEKEEEEEEEADLGGGMDMFGGDGGDGDY